MFFWNAPMTGFENTEDLVAQGVLLSCQSHAAIHV